MPHLELLKIGQHISFTERRSDDAEVRRRLRELANERRRLGYRRLLILLRREGVEMNHKKLFRIYREERLVVRKRGGRKRALGTRAPAAVPQGKNQRWSLDFVSDTLADGRRSCRRPRQQPAQRRALCCCTR